MEIILAPDWELGNLLLHIDTLFADATVPFHVIPKRLDAVLVGRYRGQVDERVAEHLMASLVSGTRQPGGQPIDRGHPDMRIIKIARALVEARLFNTAVEVLSSGAVRRGYTFGDVNELGDDRRTLFAAAVEDGGVDAVDVVIQLLKWGANANVSRPVFIPGQAEPEFRPTNEQIEDVLMVRFPNAVRYTRVIAPPGQRPRRAIASQPWTIGVEAGLFTWDPEDRYHVMRPAGAQAEPPQPERVVEAPMPPVQAIVAVPEDEKGDDDVKWVDTAMWAGVGTVIVAAAVAVAMKLRSQRQQ